MADKSGGAITISGEGMAYAELAIMKSVLKMNKVGLKHSAQRGKAIRPMYAAGLGLKASDPYDRFIEEVQKRMDKILDEVQQGQ